MARTTVMAHRDCRPALDELRPLLADPRYASVLSTLAQEAARALRPANPGEVPPLSPFRYPGGKTWAVPEARTWLAGLPRRPDLLVEPFAGGAIIGLTVAAEGLARRVVLCELDGDVAAVWAVVFGASEADAERLRQEILRFDCTRENVERRLAARPEDDLVERAFRTVLRNRTSRGGLMTSGAGLLREADAGRGVRARWYPESLAGRISFLRTLRSRVKVVHGDGLDVIAAHAGDPAVAYFVDPPYTAGGRGAGTRLYTHHVVQHPVLFEMLAGVAGPVMATYDDVPLVRSLATRHGFAIRRVTMRSTHHRVRHELLITSHADARQTPTFASGTAS